MISLALQNLCPNASWYIKGDETYENICWTDKNVIKPDKQTVETEAARIIASINAVAYKAQRAKEYPPITDYLDGIVKGDQQQIANYIAACQAVKAKYPKPE